MREQLIRYIDLLFAGASDAGDIKQEILQNTLDRYDDLISQGKSPEAAYRLAISGIGDISEILGEQPQPSAKGTVSNGEFSIKDAPWKKVLRAIAVGLYIISAIPLFVLGEMGMDTIGLCGTLAIVAVATILMVIAAKGSEKSSQKDSKTAREAEYSPQTQLRKSISSIVWTLATIAYFILSFATHAWFITWVIFPLAGAIQGLIIACIDLKEVGKNEN